MGIKNLVLGTTGADNMTPRICYIETDNTVAEITTTGFLNAAVQNGAQFKDSDMCLVSTKTTPGATVVSVGWYEVAKVGSDTSLLAPSSSSTVVGNFNATGTVTAGTGLIATTGGVTATAGNIVATAGNIIATAGSVAAATTVTATAGALVSGALAGGFAGALNLWADTTLSGALRMLAVDNASGDFDTIISNAAAVGQDQTITVPNAGAATANFLLSTGAANILAKQEFVGLESVLTFGTGTWTVTRIAQGDYVSRHTAGDETSVIGIDLTPVIRVAAAKGFRLDSFDVIYSIATDALDTHSVALDRIEYADNAAVSVNTIAITGALETAIQANPYVTNVAVDAPAFDVTADSKYVLELTVNNSATSEYDYYGIMLRFSETIG